MAGGTNGECGRDGQGRRLILNPQSGRCVLRDGASGRAILARGAKSTKPRSSRKPPSSPVSSSANLALAIALASRKRAPSPSASSPSPKRKTTTTSKKKKKASPVYNNNNNNGGYSSNSPSPSPTPRRGRGGRTFRLPMKIISFSFAVALAVVAMRWASGGALDILGKLRKFVSTFTLATYTDQFDKIFDFVDSVFKRFRWISPEAPPDMTNAELNSYFKTCCGRVKEIHGIPIEGLREQFKKTVREIEDACKPPSTAFLVNRWANILDEVELKHVHHNILYMMKDTLSYLPGTGAATQARGLFMEKITSLIKKFS
jgi:hypothetical protein